MTGLTEQDRAWADAIAALPRHAAGVEPLGVVTETVGQALIDDGWVGHDEILTFSDINAIAQTVAAAVLDALGTGAGQAAVDALAELVALKDGPRDDDYERRKPLAWAAARAAVTHHSESVSS